MRIVLEQHKKIVGRHQETLTEEESEWLLDALDRPTTSYINLGKNDYVFLGKVNGKKNFRTKKILFVAIERYN